jgi:hypothetical protein
MGNTVASGSGYSLTVGKNCEKYDEFTSNVILTFKNLFISRIEYNNSKYGKTYLAGTQDNSGFILAQNKYFNFQWKNIENEDTGESFILGNHTKKCNKNSLAIYEVMKINPVVLQANKEKIKVITYKFKNDSELDKLVKKLTK